MVRRALRCLSESLSPISHHSGSAGNEQIIAREPVLVDGATRWLPFLSGNALRHKLVREPGVLWLIEQYGLQGKISLRQLNFLLHGGNLTQSTAVEDTGRIEELRRLWPIIGLLGASLPNQIVPGLLDVWRAVLVCEENREAVRETLGYVPEELLLPAERWVCDYQYTRGDAARIGWARPEKRDKTKEQAQLMIFSGQAIQRGALWAHGFVLRHPTSLYLGCLLWSLRLWQSAGGTIGSQAARGHGQLRLYVLDGDLAQEELCQQYVEHCRSVRDEAVAWLARNVK